MPLYGQRVPILADAAADPQKGTGAVMCCTFGDQTDMAWWYTHHLPLVEAIDRAGRMTAAGRADLAGMPVAEARQRIKELLAERGLILARQATPPVDARARALRHAGGDRGVAAVVRAHPGPEGRAAASWASRSAGTPSTCSARYHAWVENLNWDWAISRQRSFGVPFPVWYCQELRRGDCWPRKSELPVDPLAATARPKPAPAAARDFTPDADVMDTWATSSLSPQIAGQRAGRPGTVPRRCSPSACAPRRTRSSAPGPSTPSSNHYCHFGQLPWQDVLISGWGLAGEGMGKISKSRGGGPMPPLEMIERYSADAVRYWAASTGTGKDAMISEEKIQMGLQAGHQAVERGPLQPAVS